MKAVVPVLALVALAAGLGWWAFGERSTAEVVLVQPGTAPEGV